LVPAVGKIEKRRKGEGVERGRRNARFRDEPSIVALEKLPPKGRKNCLRPLEEKKLKKGDDFKSRTPNKRE